MILKIIANANALSISKIDDSNDDSNIYKGVEVLPGVFTPDTNTPANNAYTVGTFEVTHADDT